MSHLIRTFTRFTTPIIAGTLAFGLFPFTKSQFQQHEVSNNEKIIKQIQDSPLYKQLANDPTFTKLNSRTQFPKQHHHNLVSAGLLYGENLFEIEPVIFQDKTDLYAFHYLGSKMISEDGKIHNGITSTLLDEGLCAAGFPLLPSKKGVTAKLTIDFKNQAPANAIVVLKAHVSEHKGRKVVIDGSLETLSNDPVTIAHGKCILVEPKWFKFFSWFSFI